tara:strand:- start:325 stop:453 length:129 start_codon:yes stop_codon:yes gene_type:complete
MKFTYLASFFIIFVILIFTALYFVEIPTPSAFVTEEYKLEIK